MKITVLGSAAAEGVPALWCECATCAQARINGGKDLRRRTAYLINDDTLIDCGPDIFWQSVRFGFDLNKIRRIFLTHAHRDHLSPTEFIWRQPGYSSVSREIAVFGNRQSIDKLKDICDGELERILARAEILSPGKAIELDGMRVLPIEAQHSTPDEQAFNFALTVLDKSILIANDTGWWADASWELAVGLNLDAAIVECTSGLHEKYRALTTNHLGAEGTIAFRDRLTAVGALKPGAKVWTNHFSHNGRCLHAKLEEFFIPAGIQPAYDGMTIEL